MSLPLPSSLFLSPTPPHLSLSSLSLTITRPRLLPPIRMGGGPRTFPGGVSKWQWKRMQAKKSKQLLKARLLRERQIYETRKRAELKAAVSDLEKPWELVQKAPNLFSVAADEQLKILADRFQRPGGFDMWSVRDGPQILVKGGSHGELMPSQRFFPKGVVHSVRPYGFVEEGGREVGFDDWIARGGGGVRRRRRGEGKEDARGNDNERECVDVEASWVGVGNEGDLGLEKLNGVENERNGRGERWGGGGGRGRGRGKGRVGLRPTSELSFDVEASWVKEGGPRGRGSTNGHLGLEILKREGGGRDDRWGMGGNGNEGRGRGRGRGRGNDVEASWGKEGGIGMKGARYERPGGRGNANEARGRGRGRGRWNGGERVTLRTTRELSYDVEDSWVKEGKDGMEGEDDGERRGGRGNDDWRGRGRGNDREAVRGIGRQGSSGEIVRLRSSSELGLDGGRSRVRDLWKK